MPTLLEQLLGGQQQASVPTMNPQGNRRQLFADMLMGVGAGLASGNPGTSAAMFQQMAQNRRQDRQQAGAQNATVQWLQSRNPELAGLVAQGAISPMDAIRMVNQKPDLPNSVQEWQYAQQNPEFAQYLQAKSQQQVAPESLGVSPIIAAGPEGRTQMFQLGNRGTVKPVEFPEGVQPLGPYDTYMQRSQGTQAGKNTADALNQLPGAAAKVADIENKVGELLNHPNFGSQVGPVDGLLPNISGGARDWQTRFDQLRGESFLQARQDLKGGGAITDFEGQKAEMALMRASQATDEQSFQTAMREFAAAVRRGYEILAQQAGQGGGRTPLDPGRTYRYNPQTGQIE